MKTFVAKNLLTAHAHVQRNKVLKGMILFFLGASATLLLTYADVNINPNISSAVSYLQQLVLTNSSAATGIVLNGTSGAVQATTYCDSGATVCRTMSQLIASGFTASSYYTTGDIIAKGYITGGQVTFNITTTVNGKALTGNITITSGDVGLGVSDSPVFSGLTVNKSVMIQGKMLVVSSVFAIKTGTVITSQDPDFSSYPVCATSSVGSTGVVLGSFTFSGYARSPSVYYCRAHTAYYLSMPVLYNAYELIPLVTTN